MHRMLLLLGFCLFSLLTFAQYQIQGTIVNADNQQPIAGASVYINNSSIATSSDKFGKFILKVSQASLYELAISAMGYVGQAIQVRLPQEGDLKIQLKQKATAIEEIVVTGVVKDGWAKWGRYFSETLLGVGYHATKTKILNPEVVQFRYDKKEQILMAVCAEPLRINNPVLGYEITYDLTDYEANMKSKYFFYAGFALFKDISKGKKKIRQARLDTYQLSLMKFIRSTYEERWEQDGYIVRKLVKQSNKTRDEAVLKYDSILYEVNNRYNGQWKLFHAAHPEVLPTHIEALRSQRWQPKEIAYLMGILQPAQVLIAEDPDHQLKQMVFSDFLYVIYPEKLAKSKNPMLKASASEVTEFSITHPDGVIIDPTGGFYPPNNLLLSGYGTNFSKIAFQLPFDYQPPN